MTPVQFTFKTQVLPKQFLTDFFIHSLLFLNEEF